MDAGAYFDVSVTVQKTVDATAPYDTFVDSQTVAEPGGMVKYKLVITNTSAYQDVELFSLTDDLFSDGAGLVDLIGTVTDEFGMPIVFPYLLTRSNATDSDTLVCYFTGSFTEPGTYPDTVKATVRQAGNHANTAWATDEATVIITDVLPDISVTKTPDRTWVPAPGGLVNYTFVVKNLSPEAATLTSLIDDKFGDLSTAAGLPRTLAPAGQPGDFFTFTKALFPSGAADTSHTNTVEASASDNDGNTATAKASATVWFFQGSVLTNTSYCSFDYDSSSPGNQFRLMFRPETQSSYLLGGQNPGQFYYNAFVSGNPGDTVDLELTIPYPFVTNGANPIHVYDGYTVTMGAYGPCFGLGPDVSGLFTITTAGGTKSSSGHAIIVLGDYDPKAWTSTTTVRVMGTVPTSGYAYVTVHLEYGLLKTTPWARSGETAISSTYGNLGNGSTGLQTYTFSSSVSGTATIQSDNVFKKVAGALGLIKGAVSGDPLPGLTVELWSGNGSKKLSSGITDEDGYYMCVYKHTGKATTFLVKVPSLGLSEQVTMKASGFVICDFEVPGL